jgi:hypothetical protein
MQGGLVVLCCVPSFAKTLFAARLSEIGQPFTAKNSNRIIIKPGLFDIKQEIQFYSVQFNRAWPNVGLLVFPKNNAL